MTTSKRPVIYFNLHLVSDATGETLNAVAKAACAQFELVHPIEHAYALVRSSRQLSRVMRDVEAAPGVVMYTIVNEQLREQLEGHCRALNIPTIAVLDPIVAAL